MVVDIHSDAQTWWLENGEIKKGSIHPTEDFGLPTHPLSSVRGATSDLNALTFHTLIENNGQPPAHLSSPAGPDSPSLVAISDYVLLNAAALLHVSGRAKDWKDGVRLARESLASGGAKAAFEGFRDTSKQAMGEDVDVKIVEDDGGVAAKNGFVKSWLKQNRSKDGSEAKEEK